MRKLFILVGVVLLAVAFTVPARAEVNFYGHIRFLTYMQDVSKEATAAKLFDDSNLIWRMDDGDSRFGARFKNGDFSAIVELRPRSDTLERLWEASWKFGAGTLTIGHSYSPEFSACGGAAYAPGTLTGYGDPSCTVRDDLVKLAIGNLNVALVAPYTGAAVTGAGTDVDTSLPKLAASYMLTVGPAAIKLFGGFQSYDLVDPLTDQGLSIDSHIIGVEPTAAFGPAYVKAFYAMGQNLGTYTKYFPKTAHGPNYDAATNTLTDADNTVYGLVLGYTISETMKIEGGYLTSEYEIDKGAGADFKEDTNSAYYITLPIQVAKNFTVIPEILILNDDDYKGFDGKTYEQGDTTYYGVAWKITF